MKRLKIGNVELENPLILAPMAGVTDQPFRLLCREEGCGLAYTEMVSAKAILYKNRNTRSLMEIHPQEGPAVLQLFGSDPEILGRIAAQVEDMAQYDTIFIGYPIWYADMPMIVYSFLEQYDLSGKTIVPFITPGPAASPAPSRPSSVSSPTPQSWKTDTPSPATAWGKLLLA